MVYPVTTLMRYLNACSFHVYKNIVADILHLYILEPFIL